MAKQYIWELETRYEEMLDECYPTYNFNGMEYTAGTILKECDPIAFRVGFNDWLDSLDNCEDCDLNPSECTCEAE